MKLKLVLKVLSISQDTSIVSNFHPPQRHRKSCTENAGTLTSTKKQTTGVWYYRPVIMSKKISKDNLCLESIFCMNSTDYIS
jgi:hypothetical protein